MDIEEKLIKKCNELQKLINECDDRAILDNLNCILKDMTEYIDDFING